MAAKTASVLPNDDGPDSLVSIHFCDARHRSNTRLNIVTLTVLTIMVGGGVAVMAANGIRQDKIADVAERAIRTTELEQAKNESSQQYIKAAIAGLRVDMGKIGHKQEAMTEKQDEINVSLRVLIQKVENNGGR